ncbi:MAG: YdcF family protein [Oscillospiraceae bacterium]|nr:YdcF family protein [Oscillospiraceae bacterium]
MLKFRFDTLNKKPKVYSIAVLTLVTLVLLALLLLFGGEREIPLSCLLVAAFFAAVTVLLLRAFLLQLRYNPYSYNTIIYFGFGLFTLFIAMAYVALYFQVRELPVESILVNVLGSLLGSAKGYMIYTFPFLLLFSAALAVSNLSLIRHEGFRPVNLLGILLALVLVGGQVLLFVRDYSVSGSQQEVMLHDLLSNLLAAIYLYFECMMLGTMVADGVTARYEPEKDKDYLIVLGCAIRRDGTPTPLLRGRLERALRFARAQEAQTGRAPIFVLSGGQGADETVSEAECMRRWLAEQGVPAERMLLEDRSTDTAENMAFSKELIFARDPQARVAFSTNKFHVFRSGIKARRVKLRAVGMGCKSKWYFWPNAAVREFIGLLTQHKGKQLLILLSLIAAYTLMTLLYYQY